MKYTGQNKYKNNIYNKEYEISDAMFCKTSQIFVLSTTKCGLVIISQMINKI